MSGVSIDTTERKQTEAYRSMMAQEMGHRMKNMLAATQSIVNQSLRTDQSLEEIRSTIAQRLGALASSSEVLHGREFGTHDVQQIVEQAVAPFNETGRIAYHGPNVTVSHQATTSLSLALHELATNAIKYGALSNSDGRVAVNWGLNGDQFEMRWIESGGPPVVEPARRGFGTKLIQMLGSSLRGNAQISFDPAGLKFSVTTSRDALTTAS